MLREGAVYPRDRRVPDALRRAGMSKSGHPAGRMKAAPVKGRFVMYLVRCFAGDVSAMEDWGDEVRFPLEHR